eukprot:m.63234 g.63234  ORF g.63234 m.63234 type:complete len:188 (-) comp16345_c0_seq2:98-661(-)
MAYVDCLGISSELLHYRRNISMRSKIVFTVLVIAALCILPLAESASWWLRAIMCICSISTAFSFVEPQRDCIVRKSGVTVEERTFMFSAARRMTYAGPASCVVVNTEPLRYMRPGRQVVIEMESGMQVQVTTTCTMDPLRQHVQVAEEISHFLDVPVVFRDATKATTEEKTADEVMAAEEPDKQKAE